MNLDTMIRRMIREELADLGLAPPPSPEVDPVAEMVGTLPPEGEWSATDLLPRLMTIAAPADGVWTVHRLGRRLTALVGRIAGGRVLRRRRGTRAGVSLYSVALVPPLDSPPSDP